MSGHFCGLDNVLVLFSFRYHYKEVLFCLDPSWSQNGLVQCWYSVKLCMFDRRISRPGCEGQASSPGQRQLFLGSGVCVFESFSGHKAFSQFLSNSPFEFTFSSGRLICPTLMDCV